MHIYKMQKVSDKVIYHSLYSKNASMKYISRNILNMYATKNTTLVTFVGPMTQCIYCYFYANIVCRQQTMYDYAN